MIVDASVLLELANPLPNPMGRRLEAILARVAKSAPLESPNLLPYELGHTIHRRRPTAFGNDLQERQALLQWLLDRVTRVPPSDETWHDVGGRAEKTQISFYDASYISLAVQRRQPLLTADGGMASHARAAGAKAYLIPADLEVLDRDYPKP